MRRVVFGSEISQRSKSEMFSATDLIRAGNKWRVEQGMSPFTLAVWHRSKTTQEFLHAMEEKFGKVIIKGRGKGHHTWVHPYVFIDIALAISPAMRVEVYGWLNDFLLKYRNDSGDSYKRMCGALWINHRKSRQFKDEIIDIARRIKRQCGVVDWQSATEDQLRLRDKIHDQIALAVDITSSNDKAIKIVFDRLESQ